MRHVLGPHMSNDKVRLLHNRPHQGAISRQWPNTYAYVLGFNFIGLQNFTTWRPMTFAIFVLSAVLILTTTPVHKKCVLLRHVRYYWGQICGNRRTAFKFNSPLCRSIVYCCTSHHKNYLAVSCQLRLVRNDTPYKLRMNWYNNYLHLFRGHVCMSLSHGLNWTEE